MKLIDKYNIKFTMGKFLEIERKYNLNPLDFPARKGIEDAEFELMEFSAKQTTPFLEAVKDKELNTKEKIKRNELLKKQRIIETKIELMKIDYTYELLRYFTGLDLVDDEELDYQQLEEFRKDYEEATKMKFNINTKGDSSGK